MIGNIDKEKFRKIIDELYDEIVIYDNNFKIVYINKACERHYGLGQEEMIGHDFWDFESRFWDNSVLPYVYREKKATMLKQMTHLGSEILTIAVPLFDKKGEIEYVAMSVRDNFSNKQIDYLNEIFNSKEKGYRSWDNNDPLIYKSEKMRKVIETSDQIVDIPAPCLILGETGVGKTLIGKYIFEKSQKYNKKFVHLNCAAIHKDLLETELFGYVEGSFTGAKKGGKDGLIKIADGGILFLDEISELPYNLQSKLLQFIQEKEFYPVGGIKPIKVDLKVIAATNRNLLKMVEVKEFREDLYYRLNVFEIEIPPLRERPEDIKELANFFLNRFNANYHKASKISDEAMNILTNYSWKGNVRELSHVIERLVVIIDDLVIRAEHIPKKLFEIDSCMTQSSDNLDEMLSIVEEKMVKKTYDELKTTREVAKKLGISQSRASRLIRKYIK
ncbi:sigma-54 interaction domain-containing protein [Alkalibacter mobilis]|uniref:sigma-54 interaction domain-containing protein n=1 Tax=Alkalibacter mobilis TaxID=2787712 RepID=UPI00189F54C8|nr:sigma 54-interacting transcriptional regulator [Alkalibacter mobilis]MBF7096646.1 sigma 54-interacting transcriptional regulator [Alkalibacter mobilis]